MSQRITVSHVRSLIQNIEEVKKLLDIHHKLTGNKRGNRSAVNVLNKSGVILLVACWEAYIEDLAKKAFESLLTTADRPDFFTAKVLAQASRDLVKSEDERKIWELAGNGWKTVLNSYKDKILEKYLSNFNTAKAKQVDLLFEDLIGLKSTSSFWHWQGMSKENSTAQLDELITMRGEIAHRVQANNKVLKKGVYISLNFIQNLAAITSNRVSIYIASRAKSKNLPWPIVSYGNRR